MKNIVINNSTSVEKGQEDFDVNNIVINNSTSVEQRTRGLRCEQHCYK